VIHLEPSHLLAADTLQLALERAIKTWKWYVVRASGFLSAGLLFMLMISGIGHVTGLTYKYIEPLKAWAIHKAMAIALCAAIFIHVFFILIDNYVPFSLKQILIPFQSNYTTGAKIANISIGSWGVTLGILAMYGSLIIVASSLGWINSHKKSWKLLHYLSYAVFVMVFIHALYTGYDLTHGVLRAGWMLAMAIVIVAIISRLRRAGSLKINNDEEPKS